MLDGDVKYLKGVGPRRAALMAKLGIRSPRQLLFHPPRRYLDRSLVKPVSGLRPGEEVTVFGRVADTSLVRARRGLSIFNLLLDDGTGQLLCRWFNQPYLKDRFGREDPLVVSGQVRWERGLSMANPEYEQLDGGEAELVHTGRIVPLYPSTAGLSNRQLRTVIRGTLDQHLGSVDDPLPRELRDRHGLPGLREALESLHFPNGLGQVQEARRRLAFDELLALQLLLAAERDRRRARGLGVPLGDRTWRRSLTSVLPFGLTDAQQRVLAEAESDLESNRPMYRLLQGDVGCGKTVVALGLLAKAARSGRQAALMAPTEVLAEQHYLVLRPWLEEMGVSSSLLTSRGDRRARAKAAEGLAAGGIMVGIGTHALIQESVRFRDLGLAIIDEQHRFGVGQRAALQAKGPQPHMLVMTATPIPRTLSMVAYGDLDVSIIDQMPPGRVPPVTRWTSEHNRGRMLEFVAKRAGLGSQAFFVCPVIEETEANDLKAAARLHQQLSELFPGLPVGLVHGRLRIDERRRAMESFRDGMTRLLVATTVIEVGIDVPNATVMVVEQAERFGLSQLHQLRGRIGRGGQKSWCILMAGDRLGPEARARLDAMQEISDGFRIAEKDLELRGPGELWGSRQHGLPELRLANLVTDAPLVPPARDEARRAFASDPDLSQDGHRGLRQLVRWHFPDAGRLAGVG